MLTTDSRFFNSIKENLRKSYADASNDFQRQLDAISAELVSLDGELDVSISSFFLGSFFLESLCWYFEFIL